MAHLPETAAWRQCAPPSDAMRAAAARCPHPDLAKLNASPVPYIGTLYCAVTPAKLAAGEGPGQSQSQAVSTTSEGSERGVGGSADRPSRSLLDIEHLRTSAHSHGVGSSSPTAYSKGDGVAGDGGALAVESESESELGSPSGRPGRAKGSGSRDKHKQKSKSKNSFNCDASVLPPNGLYAVPLSGECMGALFSHYLWPPPTVSQSSNTLDIISDFSGAAVVPDADNEDGEGDAAHAIANGGGAAGAGAGVSALGMFGKAVQPTAVSLLPDHARRRLACSRPYGINRQLQLAVAAAEPLRATAALDGPLRCSYILLPDEKAVDTGDSSGAPSPRKSGGRGSATSSKAAAADGSGGSSSSAVTMQAYYLVQVIDESQPVIQPQLHPAQQSVVDAHDKREQERERAAAAELAYQDAEDVLLRSLVQDEHRRLLGRDTAVSTPRTSAAATAAADGGGGGPNSSASGRRRGGKEAQSKQAAGAGMGGRVHSADTGSEVDADWDAADDETDTLGSKASGGRGSSSKGGGGGSSKRKWDPNVLSYVCRWRSCMCDAVAVRHPTTGRLSYKQLCAYHEELKQFVDGKSSSSKLGGGAGGAAQLESAKYLPRKAPIFPSASAVTAGGGGKVTADVVSQVSAKRDLQIIRAASSLLQELWDGKLRTTLRSFTKKVARDIALRPFLESCMPTFLSAHPLYSPEAQLHLLQQQQQLRRNPFGLVSYLHQRVKSAAQGGQELSLLPPRPTWAIWKSKKYYER